MSEEFFFYVTKIQPPLAFVEQSNFINAIPMTLHQMGGQVLGFPAIFLQVPRKTYHLLSAIYECIGGDKDIPLCLAF